MSHSVPYDLLNYHNFFNTIMYIMAPNVKRSKSTKGKKRYIKKIKEMIGQDLVQDTVGTNQLLDYNQLMNPVIIDTLII